MRLIKIGGGRIFFVGCQVLAGIRWNLATPGPRNLTISPSRLPGFFLVSSQGIGSSMTCVVFLGFVKLSTTVKKHSVLAFSVFFLCVVQSAMSQKILLLKASKDGRSQQRAAAMRPCIQTKLGAPLRRDAGTTFPISLIPCFLSANASSLTLSVRRNSEKNLNLSPSHVLC
jgi:hypothetical protein